jgi:hypothetical protein
VTISQIGDDMPTEWYFQNNGQVVGPINPKELLAGVRKGVIQHDSLIRKDDSQWVAAWEVGGLLEAADRDLVQYHCPYCNARVHKPPTTCIECAREITAVYRSREQVGELNALAATSSNAIETVAERHSGGIMNWLKSLFSKS